MDSGTKRGGKKSDRGSILKVELMGCADVGDTGMREQGVKPRFEASKMEPSGLLSFYIRKKLKPRNRSHV